MALCSILILSACGGERVPAEKGVEDGVAVGGKLDGFWDPTHHGELVFSAANEAAFADEQWYHAWELTLDEGALVELWTETSALNLDTVMYVYHRADESELWARVARDDDSGEGMSSRLGLYVGTESGADAPAGQYRVLVKSFKREMRGDFALHGECRGDGCPLHLTDPQLDGVQEAIDNICGDTFCAGDFNWWTRGLTCDGAGTCTIAFAVKGYSETWWATKLAQIAALPPDTLIKSGGVAPKLWTASIVSTETDEGEGTWARTLCEMQGDFYSMGDVVSAGGYSYSEKLWDRLLADCVDPLEMILHGL